MIILERTEVAGLITPYSDDIWHAFELAFAAYEELPPAMRLEFCGRTRANIIRDGTVSHIRRLFTGRDGCKIIENESLKGLFLLELLGKLTLRFKKLPYKDSRGFTSKQSRLYATQEKIPGLTETMHLDASYQLNPLRTKVRTVFLRCPRGVSTHWTLHLDRVQEAVNELTLFPMPPVIEDPASDWY